MIKNINKVSGCLLILPLKIHKLYFHTTVLWRSWLSGRGLGWWASLRPHVSTFSRVKGTISCVWGPIAHLGVLVPTLGSIKSVCGEWVCARRVSPCVVYVCMRVEMLVCLCGPVCLCLCVRSSLRLILSVRTSQASPCTGPISPHHTGWFPHVPGALVILSVQGWVLGCGWGMVVAPHTFY